MTQADEIVAAVRDVLGYDLLGAYLHGSPVLGGWTASSDVDVLGVTARPTSDDEKRALFERCRELTNRPRHIELTLFVRAPWRYPPWRDFQYGDWYDELAPAQHDPDLATLLTIVLRHGETLVGPPPAELLDPVPHEDLVRAMTESIDFDPAGDDVRNGLLTLARIWTTLATGEIVRKDVAANWVLERADLPLLARARDLYLAGDRGEWDVVEARATGDELLRAIRAM